MCFQKKIKLEQWQSGRRRRSWWSLVVPETKWPRKRRTCINTHLWSNVHDHLVEVLIIRRELSILLFQGHELLRLGARYWLGAPNGWNITGHRPQVLSCSIGEPIHPIFIGSTGRSYLHPQIRMGRRIIPISLPQPAIIGLLKMKKEIIIFDSRKIITYEIKWLNEQTTKCWAWLSTNCCILFWRSSLCICISINNSIVLGSRPRDKACKKNN